ncbi:MAG: hypothetical protein M1834_000763 [Cirrosporium novae-zelandiae]|nr:MAG: hypothetical protein M1834_000763 [Cirrosporium novae-zelandiae]
MDQSSLEGVIDFTSTEPLDEVQGYNPSHVFDQIINYCEPLQASAPYKRITLIRATYEHIYLKDNFLKLFFQYIAYEIHSKDFSHGLIYIAGINSMTISQKVEVETHLSTFGDYLFDNFFLLLRALTRQTPQPSSASLSSPTFQCNEQTGSTGSTSSTERLATLRAQCLIRDRHRCVISRKFDYREGRKRFKKHGENNAYNDDGLLLKDEDLALSFLEVAQIIPHSLMSFSIIHGESKLNDSRKTALEILNMFDPNLIQLINGPEIDQPRNAITLTREFRRQFDNFSIYFDPINNQPHTYRIDSAHHFKTLRDPIFPITRTLYLTAKQHPIDPPSPRILAFHRACVTILKLSNARSYMNQVVEALLGGDGVVISADGSSDLGRMVRLKWAIS